MFGRLAFMTNGNMACGVLHDDIVAQVGQDQHEKALREPGARAMDFTGRVMKGFLYIGSAGYDNAKDLERWVKMGVAHGASLPKIIISFLLHDQLTILKLCVIIFARFCCETSEYTRGLIFLKIFPFMHHKFACQRVTLISLD